MKSSLELKRSGVHIFPSVHKVSHHASNALYRSSIANRCRLQVCGLAPRLPSAAQEAIEAASLGRTTTAFGGESACCLSRARFEWLWWYSRYTMPRKGDHDRNRKPSKAAVKKQRAEASKKAAAAKRQRRGTSTHLLTHLLSHPAHSAHSAHTAHTARPAHRIVQYSISYHSIA